MRTTEPQIPPLRRHASGQACVYLGKYVYLGRWGTTESVAAYERTIKAWLDNGRRWPVVIASGLTTEQLALAFLEHARTYYVKSERQTSSVGAIRRAMSLLILSGLGQVPAISFATSHLRHFQTYLAADPHRRWARGTMNAYTKTAVRAFEWAVGEQLLGPAVDRQSQLAELRAVPLLKRGRPASPGLKPARETQDREPADLDHIKRTMLKSTPTLRAMIEVQLLTGMRPLEITHMRRGDLRPTINPAVMRYTPRPDANKLDHAAKVRHVYIGPRAWAIIAARLPDHPDAYVFRPRDAREEARATLTRSTPAWPSHSSKARHVARGRGPLKIRDRYSTDSYRQAIKRACLRAGVPVWTPNQLRHNAASYIAEHESVQVAQILLGHADMATTMIYVKVAERQAINAVLKHG